MKFNLIRCNKCGKYVDVKARSKNKLPTMMQFVDQAGKITSLCQACIMELGEIARGNDMEAKEKFFAELADSTSGLLEDDF